MWIQKTGSFNHREIKFNDLDGQQKEQREAHYLTIDLRFILALLNIMHHDSKTIMLHTVCRAKLELQVET